MRRDVGPAEVNELLVADFSTGKLFWGWRDEKWFLNRFSPANTARAWNKRYAGKEALTALGNHGYRFGSILGYPYLSHRVIWALRYGVWPKVIDHIDGDKLNNSISNLRSVEHSQNMKNTPIPSNNRSGRIGVSWHKQRKVWCARIEVNGVRRHLGVSKDFREACQMRERAEREFGFHRNHGRTPPEPPKQEALDV